MKTWHLALIQIWVLCFSPAWIFLAIFAPLTLTPEPVWPAFVLLVSPPFVALFCSVTMWIAKKKKNVQWQKKMAITLIVFPIISVVFPFFILD